MLLAPKQNKSVIAGGSISPKSSKEVHIWTTTWDFQQYGCATSRGSDQHAHTHSLTSPSNSPCLLSYWMNSIKFHFLKWRVDRLTCAYSCQNATLLEISCRSSYLKNWRCYRNVEVQCYGSYKRMLWSLKRSNYLKWRSDTAKGENLIKIKQTYFR